MFEPDRSQLLGHSRVGEEECHDTGLIPSRDLHAAEVSAIGNDIGELRMIDALICRLLGIVQMMLCNHRNLKIVRRPPDQMWP